MCEWVKSGSNRIDPCMRDLIRSFEYLGIKTVASCCGHGKYPQTIIVDVNGKTFEYFSGKDLPRTRNFYRKDPEGHYYIPEVVS